MKSKNNKRLLLVLDALRKYSDETHILSNQDLIDYCFKYGIDTERKTIYDVIDSLRDFGYEIIQVRSPKFGYYLVNPLFETVELRLLIDAIQSSSFISEKKSNQLIQKITSLTNEHHAKKLLNPVIYPKNKTNNEKIFYIIDELQNALEENREITFLYFDITLQKEKKYRKQRKRYSLIPYAMVWDNQRYYCIGYDKKHAGFSHYRIDKMDDIQLSEVVNERVQFNLEEYTSRVFGMYLGSQETVTLRVDRSLTNVIFDQFGQDVLINNVIDNTFDITFTMNIAPTFISWLFQFDNRIEVLSPNSLIDEMKKTATSVLALYK